MGMPTYESNRSRRRGRESLPAGPLSDCLCFDRRRTPAARRIVGMGMPTYSKFIPIKFTGSATPQSGV
jgi:hypothetical protein